ncbi:COG0319 Predicted metal-dependent hydrolase [actinobacterium SCGC AAA044-D11]
MGIEIANNSGVDCHEDEIVEVAAFALDKMGIHPDSDLGITLVDEEEITKLHVQWMDLPGPTDVLSFPMDELKPFSASDGPGIIGDIVICPQFAAKQAVNHSVADEISLLTVHGVLHLLGFDHVEPNEHKEMFDLQDKTLADWRNQR